MERGHKKMQEQNVFGKKSYEYAIGRIRASECPPLSIEQWARLRNSDFETASKLLFNFGYPSEANVYNSIEREGKNVNLFIREISPDESLTDLLFFEVDALNLKMFKKALLVGRHVDINLLSRGGFDPELLRVCAEHNDYSLLGEDIAQALSSLEQMVDPCKISCLIDIAMYQHALLCAKKKNSKILVSLFSQYALCKNIQTSIRLQNLHLYSREYACVFLPVSGESGSDYGKYTLGDANKMLQNILFDCGTDGGMGVIAQYYFMKKNEASSLRLLFTEKEAAGYD